MSAYLRTRCIPIAKSAGGFVFLLLVSLNYFSCNNQTAESILPVLDSTTDTAAWVQEVRAVSSESGDVNNRIRALNALGVYYSTQANFDSALYYYIHAANQAEKANLVHEQVRALIKTGKCYLELQRPDSAVASMKEALLIGTNARSDKDIAFALQELGIYYLIERDSANALKYLNEEIKYDTALHDSSAMAACYSNIAMVYSDNEDYLRSIHSYQKALVIAERLDDDTNLAIFNLNLGIVFREQGSYDSALHHLLLAAPFFEQIQYAKELASCYNSIGNLYCEVEEPRRAIEYHTRSLHLRDSIGNKRGIAGSLTNLGQAYILLGDYDTAISYLNRSLLIKNELGDSDFIASSVDLLGEAYYHKKEFDKAEAYYKKALELKSIADDPKLVALTLNKLSRLYQAMGKNHDALEHLKAARSRLEKIGAKKYLLDNYKITTDIFLTEGQSDSALLYMDLFISMKDSVLNEEKQKAITEMEVKYDSESKEHEIVLLNERDKVKEATVERQHTLIYSLVVGAALLLVVVALLFVAIRSRRLALRQSKVIIEQKQTIIEQKQTMMSELHHRIKNNLQVLSSLLELQQSRIQDPAMAELMQEIDQRLTAMLLIHQGLYGDHVGSQVNMRTYIEALIDNLCQSYGYAAAELNISKDVASIELDADKALSLGFVCNEVISNWFKHVLKKNDDATLHIEFTGKLLRFSDNGTGIPAGNKAELNRSFGLRLIQLFSRELKATLLTHSDERGTIVTLEIPEVK